MICSAKLIASVGDKYVHERGREGKEQGERAVEVRRVREKEKGRRRGREGEGERERA